MPVKTKSSIKKYTMEQIRNISNKDNVFLAIEGNVYNVTEFLDSHPGGGEILMEQNGMDATEAFNDVGHSSAARELLQDFKVGILVDRIEAEAEDKNLKSYMYQKMSSKYMVPVCVAGAVLVGALGWYHWKRK